MKTIKIMTCTDAIEANIIKGKLESEGIHCFITNEDTATLLPHHFIMQGAGVHVFINKNDLEKAISILDVDNTKSYEVICPECNSENITVVLGRNKLRKIIRIFFSLLAVMPLGKHQYTCYCRDCKLEFRQ